MTPEQQRAIAIAKARKAKAMATQPTFMDQVGAVGRSALTQGNLFMGGPFSDEAVLAPLATVGTTAARAFAGQGISTDQIASDYSSNLANINKSLQNDRNTAPIGTFAGELGGNIVTGGALGTTGAGQGLANLYSNSGLLGKTAISGALGAGSTGLYSLGASEGSIPERIQKTGLDQASLSNPMAFGGLVGGAIPVAGAGLNVAKKAVTAPFVPKIADDLKPLVQRAVDFDIPLRADQVAPTKVRNTVQKVSQALPFSGADAFEGLQRNKYNQALARSLGVDDLSFEGYQKARNEVSNAYANVLKGREINLGESLINKIDDFSEEASKNVSPQTFGIIKNSIDEIKGAASDGVVSGDKINDLRAVLLKRSKNAEGAAREYIGDLVEYIDDAVETGIGPDGAKALQETRRKYRNLKTIEGLMEKSVTGEVNPTDVLQRVASSKYIKASTKKVGEDDLVDLARIGKLLAKKGGSDTFEKSAYTAGLIGTGAGGYANLPITAGTILGNRLVQQGILSNQKLIKAGLGKSSKSSVFLSPSKRLALAAALAQSQEK